jgi:zinc protease
LLAEVLSERMRVRLREELGATYAPSATFVSRDALPEGSYFVVYAEVDRHKAKQAAEVVTKEIEAIRRRGLTEEEFTRIKIPFLRQREDQVRTNEYWCFTALREAQRKPELLEAVRNRERDTAAITRGELNQLAERYLVRKDAYFFVCEPEPVQEWKK